MAFRQLVRRVSKCDLKPAHFRAATYLHFTTNSRSSEAIKSANKTKTFKGDRQLSSNSSSYLTGILSSEINSARNSDFLRCPLETPEDFPFAIQDNAGWRTVVLEREFNGEGITVLVDVPSYATEHDDDDEPSVPLAVFVSKPNGLLLEFHGRVFPDRIAVRGLSINTLGDSKDGRKYAGPEFLMLREDIQKAFQDYLEARGVTSSAANFLLEYIMVKDAKEYLQWLKNLKALIAQK